MSSFSLFSFEGLSLFVLKLQEQFLHAATVPIVHLDLKVKRRGSGLDYSYLEILVLAGLL